MSYLCWRKLLFCGKSFWFKPLTWMFFIVTELWAILALWLAGAGKSCPDLSDVSQQSQWGVFRYCEYQDSPGSSLPVCQWTTQLQLTLQDWNSLPEVTGSMCQAGFRASVLFVYISCICEHKRIFSWWKIRICQLTYCCITVQHWYFGLYFNIK